MKTGCRKFDVDVAGLVGLISSATEKEPGQIKATFRHVFASLIFFFNNSRQINCKKPRCY